MAQTNTNKEKHNYDSWKNYLSHNLRSGSAKTLCRKSQRCSSALLPCFPASLRTLYDKSPIPLVLFLRPMKWGTYICSCPYARTPDCMAVGLFPINIVCTSPPKVNRGFIKFSLKSATLLVLSKLKK